MPSLVLLVIMSYLESCLSSHPIFGPAHNHELHSVLLVINIYLHSCVSPCAIYGPACNQIPSLVMFVIKAHTDFPNIGLMPNTLRSCQAAGIISRGAARPTALPESTKTVTCRYLPTHQCISRSSRRAKWDCTE